MFLLRDLLGTVNIAILFSIATPMRWPMKSPGELYLTGIT
jgi:hypothetical protein